MEKELPKALTKLIHAVVQSTLTKKEGMPLMTYKTG